MRGKNNKKKLFRLDDLVTTTAQWNFKDIPDSSACKFEDRILCFLAYKVVCSNNVLKTTLSTHLCTCMFPYTSSSLY